MDGKTAIVRRNRQNCLKSTGPKTEAGKAIAKRNHLRHGLRANPASLDGEDGRQFNVGITLWTGYDVKTIIRSSDAQPRPSILLLLRVESTACDRRAIDDCLLAHTATERRHGPQHPAAPAPGVTLPRSCDGDGASPSSPSRWRSRSCTRSRPSRSPRRRRRRGHGAAARRPDPAARTS